MTGSTGAIHETDADAARVWATFACGRLTGDRGVLPERPLPVALVSELGLGPLLYRALTAEGDTRARLFLAEFRHATTANLLRLAHARRLRERFEAAGVAAVLLKGAATLVRFGDEPGLRPMADLDLLVRPPDVGEAAALLRAAGLAERDRYPLSGARSHAISFVGAAGPLDFDVDLHQGLAPWPLAAALSRAILSHHEVVDGWRIPYPVDAVCATAVHRAGHGFGGRCVELVDLKRLVGRLDDRGWEALVDAAGRFGVLGAVYASLRQAYWWLGPAVGPAARGFAALGQRLHAARRALLHGLAPVDAPVRPRPFLNGPLGRNLVVMPCATEQGIRALAAATRLLPFRVADEWQRHRREARGVGPAVRRLLAQLVFGATSPAPPPGPSAR